ncbi:MAG TPA: heavy metal-binding domain-containing protein [Bacteroidia bacterium]|nr:heavy metal-binding domain-containing protein [Bacteroidia bacterium]
MKKAILFPVFALAITFGACSNSSTDKKEPDSATASTLDTTKLAKGTTFYQCEMHPQVTSDKPGKCPKCGMDLQKVEKK